MSAPTLYISGALMESGLRRSVSSGSFDDGANAERDGTTSVLLRGSSELVRGSSEPDLLFVVDDCCFNNCLSAARSASSFILSGSKSSIIIAGLAWRLTCRLSSAASLDLRLWRCVLCLIVSFNYGCVYYWSYRNNAIAAHRSTPQLFFRIRYVSHTQLGVWRNADDDPNGTSWLARFAALVNFINIRPG